MENHNVHITQADKTMLKQKALEYLPRNLNEPEAQRQILKMIAQVVPGVASCLEESDRQIWPRVAQKTLPMNQAIAQCAYQVDQLIGATFLERLVLKKIPSKALMQAWIGLDYYSYVLKPDYSVNIRNLQNHISVALLAGKEQKERKSPPGAVSARPVDGYGPTAPAKPVDDYSQTVPVKSAGGDCGPTEPVKIPQDQTVKATAETFDSTAGKKGKVNKRKGKLLLAAVLVLVAVLLVPVLFSKSNRTEAAIRKIGTVTLDSLEQIEDAEQLFEELTEEQQSRVDNREDLTAARAQYDCLVTEDAIDKIGKVTLESEQAILQAEKLYDGLSRESRNLLKNYKTLTAARKEFDRLQAAVKKASDAIDAIGTVTLNSKDKIEAARKAYDDLKKDKLQEYLDKKVKTLTDAEKQYTELVSQDIYDTGMAHYDKASYEDAIKCFDTIIADYPETKALETAKRAKADCQIALSEKAYAKSDYYGAMSQLNAVDAKYRHLESYQKQHEKIITALNRVRPGNGSNVAGSLNWGRCYVKVTADKQDLCFKIENVKDSQKYKMVYVRAGQTATINVEDGEYYVKWATGEHWYDKTHLFGDDTVYKSKNTVEFTTSYEGSWVYFWYVDLNLGESGFTANTITANQF